MHTVEGNGHGAVLRRVAVSLFIGRGEVDTLLEHAI
jgi:hypothetical protein